MRHRKWMPGARRIGRHNADGNDGGGSPEEAGARAPAAPAGPLPVDDDRHERAGLHGDGPLPTRYPPRGWWKRVDSRSTLAACSAGTVGFGIDLPT